MKKFFLLIIIISIFTLSSCKSVAKYNTQVAALHGVEELREDVDFAKAKLEKLHPNLYHYITKDALDNAFKKLKSSINKPMSSITFYSKIAPIISKIGQGHTSIASPHKRQTKKEIKTKGKRKYPFRSLKFTTLNNKIYVVKGYGKDSLMAKGTELLKIDDTTVDELVASYKNLRCGDGYNKTFVPQYIRKNIGRLYYATHTLKDSIKLTFKLKDSIYTKYLYAFLKKDKKIANKAKKEPVKKFTKAAKKAAKKKKRKQDKWNWIHGYDKYTKESMRNFKFFAVANKKVAYMKIRGFTKWDYKDFYDDVFKQIDSVKVDNLIIDLRDNLGGRLSEIDYIYSYLTNKEYTFIKPAKMTKANSWMYPIYHSGSVLSKLLKYSLFPVAKTIQLLKVKKIDGKPHFKFKSAKLQKPKKEHVYNGKIYVLINPMSFSASSLLSNKLKATKRAYFVGDETGGAYNSTVAGMFANIILPNSKENLRVGVMVLETAHKTAPDGYGVKPDKYIKPTTLDTDEQLNWILDAIAKD